MHVIAQVSIAQFCNIMKKITIERGTLGSCITMVRDALEHMTLFVVVSTIYDTNVMHEM